MEWHTLGRRPRCDLCLSSRGLANSKDSPGAPSAVKMNAEDGKLLGIVRELMQADIKFDPNDRESVHKVVEAIFAARSRKAHGNGGEGNVEAERAAPTMSREPAAETSLRSMTRSEEGRISGNKGSKIENSLKAKHSGTASIKAKPVVDKFRPGTSVRRLMQDPKRGHRKPEAQSPHMRVKLIRNLAIQADVLRGDIGALNHMLELAKSMDLEEAMGTGAEAEAQPWPATSPLAKGGGDKALDQLVTIRKMVNQRREGGKQKQGEGFMSISGAQQLRGHVQAPIPETMKVGTLEHGRHFQSEAPIPETARVGPLEYGRHFQGEVSPNAIQAEKLVQRSLSGASANREARLATRRYSKEKGRQSKQDTIGGKIKEQLQTFGEKGKLNPDAMEIVNPHLMPTHSLIGHSGWQHGLTMINPNGTAPYTVFPQFPPGYKSTIPVIMDPRMLGTMSQVPQLGTQTQKSVSPHQQVQAALHQRLTGLGVHHPGGQGIPQGTQVLQHVMETPQHQYQHQLQMHALQMQQQTSPGQQQQQTLTYETLMKMMESAARSQRDKESN